MKWFFKEIYLLLQTLRSIWSIKKCVQAFVASSGL